MKKLITMFVAVTVAVTGFGMDDEEPIKKEQIVDGAALLQQAKSILVCDAGTESKKVKPDSSNSRKACRLIEKAADAGCGEALFLLGVMLENDRTTVKRLQEKGLDLTPIILSADFGRAQDVPLGSRSIDEITVKIAEKIVDFYCRAIECGCAEAKPYAAQMYGRISEFKGKDAWREKNIFGSAGNLDGDKDEKSGGQPEIKKVSFTSCRLGLSHPKGASSYYVGGPIRLELSSAPARYKRPILRIVGLCDVNGITRYYEGFFLQPKSYVRMSTGDFVKMLEQSGEAVSGANIKKLSHDAKAISCRQTLVDRAQYATLVIGSAKSNSGYFKVKGKPVKLLLYRIEVWQNGGMVKAYESSHSGLGRLVIPDDWYVWGKYPELYDYVQDNF